MSISVYFCVVGVEAEDNIPVVICELSDSLCISLYVFMHMICVVGVEAEDGLTVVVRELSGGGVH